MHRDTLARNLQALRRERGLSLAELGRATGISSSFLSLVEQAGSDITIGRLIRLAEFYGIELPDLITGGHSQPAGHVHVLKADPAKIIHSEEEGVDVYDLSGGTRWNIVAALGVHQPGGGVEVDEPQAREAMIFVLSGIFEIAFANEPPTRLRRGEGAIYLTTAPYRVTNVGKTQGRVLAIALHPDRRRDAQR